ncbi:hypothetical protein Godav_009537 [Gossypium davidsonii]|uniref:Uncharacterized protein n=4 Tax=Gossypium TaxID=3633 RepID=A0A7J9CCT7_GOSGO|nr:hypothetical protein [Gossypium davidsonii]MBA0659713.1 hypothetical protein [Gossypium klotzschianum]MBA0746198.1 hypothetical protein [Gossypium gossypioides]MBA0837435.1 hypothetical protein [Gossypium armourianum]
MRRIICLRLIKHSSRMIQLL